MLLRNRSVCGFVALSVMAFIWSGPAYSLNMNWFQGFETDTSGWLDFGGTITRVSSGTNGVTSSSGSFHAEVTTGPSTGDGAFTRFGGYSSVYPSQGFRQYLDIYIDVSAGSVGDGWFLDNAINGNDGAWEEAGGVGAEKTAAGTWSIAADADGGAYPGGGIAITSSGWYTIVSEWLTNGSTIDRNTFIYNSSNTLIYSNFNLMQVDIADAGGNRYGWLARSSGSGLTIAVDNSRLEIVPEPATVTLLTVGSAALAWKRKKTV